jgi:hypothetical protein
VAPAVSTQSQPAMADHMQVEQQQHSVLNPNGSLNANQPMGPPQPGADPPAVVPQPGANSAPDAAAAGVAAAAAAAAMAARFPPIADLPPADATNPLAVHFPPDKQAAELVPPGFIVVAATSESVQNVAITQVYSSTFYMVEDSHDQTFKSSVLIEGLCHNQGTTCTEAIAQLANAITTSGLDRHFNYQGVTSALIQPIKIMGTNEASDKAFLYCKSDEDCLSLLEGRSKLSFNVLSNEINAHPSRPHFKLGNPYITKNPGVFSLNPAETVAAHYILTCPRFSGMHCVEAQHIIRMAIWQLTHQLQHVPIEQRAYAVQCIQNMQPVLHLSFKQYNLDHVHLFATNPALVDQLTGMVYPANNPTPGHISITIPGYGPLTLAYAAYTPPVYTPLQLFMSDKQTRLFIARALRIEPEKANNRCLGHLTPAMLSLLEQALRDAGIALAPAGPTAPAVQQVSLYQGTTCRGALLVNCADEASQGKGMGGLRVKNGLILSMNMLYMQPPDFVPIPRISDDRKRPREDTERQLGDDVVVRNRPRTSSSGRAGRGSGGDHSGRGGRGRWGHAPPPPGPSRDRRHGGGVP